MNECIWVEGPEDKSSSWPGSMAANSRHGPGAGHTSMKQREQTGIGSSLKLLKAIPSDMLPSARPHLLNLSPQGHQLGTKEAYGGHS